MEMWSARLTSSAHCSDFLPNPDSLLTETDLYWRESPPPRTSQRNRTWMLGVRELNAYYLSKQNHVRPSASLSPPLAAATALGWYNPAGAGYLKTAILPGDVLNWSAPLVTKIRLGWGGGVRTLGPPEPQSMQLLSLVYQLFPSSAICRDAVPCAATSPVRSARRRAEPVWCGRGSRTSETGRGKPTRVRRLKRGLPVLGPRGGNWLEALLSGTRRPLTEFKLLIP
jgi:hypothetical protein